MAPTPELWRLPAALRTYNVKYLDLDITTASQECFVCYRNFGDKDDPDDPDEIPCNPVELQPCKHVMGTECFRQLMEIGMDTCQLCRTHLTCTQDPVPAWLQYLTSSAWFTSQIDSTRSLLPKVGRNGDQFDELCQRLFRGDLGLKGASTLLAHLLVSPVATTVNLTLLGAVVQATLSPLAWIYGNYLIELVAYISGLIFAITLLHLDFEAAHSRWYTELLIGLSLKVISLVIGWKVFLMLSFIHAFFYAVVAAFLIGYGIAQRPFLGI